MDPQLIQGSLGQRPSQVRTQRHLDRFSRFCTVHPCVQQTQRPRYAAIDRIYTLRAGDTAKNLIVSRRIVG